VSLDGVRWFSAGSARLLVFVVRCCGRHQEGV